ncbi:unnamed protein product [Sphagnum jensenii]|uniref:AP2/ERF domain-containing protein n=1 Tax=Sphagnum jensenii TaxID=128206 RepID=A0ABP0W5B4_9BRYO
MSSTIPRAGGAGRSRNKRFLGVRQRPSGRWVAEIKDTTQKIRLWLGTFDCAEDAARAYDEAAWMLRGTNTRTNFMPPAAASSSSFSSRASSTNFSTLLPSKSARLGLFHRRSSLAAAKLESTAAGAVASETENSLTSSCTVFKDVLPSCADELEVPVVTPNAPSGTDHSVSSSMALSNQEQLCEAVEVAAVERKYSSSNGINMISDSSCSYGSSTEESLTIFPEMDHKEWLKAFAGTSEQQYLGDSGMTSETSCTYYGSTEESLTLSFPEMGDSLKWLEEPAIRRERQYLQTQPSSLEDDDETSTCFVAAAAAAAEDSSENDFKHYYTTSFDFSATDLEPLEKVSDTSSLEDPALSDDTMLLNEHFCRMKVQCTTPISSPLCVANIFQECLLLSSLAAGPDQGSAGTQISNQDQVIWNSCQDLAPLCLVS